MDNHQRFEELIIEASFGEIAADKEKELAAHLAGCASCQKISAEYQSLTRYDLPMVHEQYGGPEIGGDQQVRRIRFVEAAERKGFHFSVPLTQNPVGRSWQAFTSGMTLRTAALAAMAPLVIIIMIRFERGRTGTVNAPIAELKQQLDDAHAEVAKRSVEGEENSVARREAAARSAKLTSNIFFLEQRLNALQVQLDSEVDNSTALRAGVEEKNQSLAASERRRGELETELAKVKNENSALADSHRADEVLAAVQQKQLDELTRELKAKETVIGETKVMMSADRDIRDLMGARQLHIVDVFDADPNGKRQKRFGRVFYTEGKSLVFYAFDLANPGIVEAKQSFEAWGTKYGEASNQAVKLGMLYMDDKSQRRWALKVDDPFVLGEIDSVFVTEEASRTGSKPTGPRLLFAFLKNPANHP